ncbi:hypothetical protein G9P44_001483 [Scheffersomyces stipitis]|nr:hypothetical protein G9P44_001483 [Scheffersomyces stipitis]
MWNKFGSKQLGESSGIVGLGSAFKASDTQKKYASRFLVVNENMDIVSVGGTGAAMLLGVKPNKKSGEICKTVTSTQEIIDDITTVLYIPGQTNMVAFCITLTGKDGLFGYNNWYGQVKFFPMKDSGTASYAQVPCKSYINKGDWFWND